MWDSAQLTQNTAFGVTTVLDMFAEPDAIRAMQDQADEPGSPFADVRSAGFMVTAPGGHGTEFEWKAPTIERPEDAAAFVAARIAEGSDYIKVGCDL